MTGTELRSSALPPRHAPATSDVQFVPPVLRLSAWTELSSVKNRVHPEIDDSSLVVPLNTEQQAGLDLAVGVCSSSLDNSSSSSALEISRNMQAASVDNMAPAGSHAPQDSTEEMLSKRHSVLSALSAFIRRVPLGAGRESLRMVLTASKSIAGALADDLDVRDKWLEPATKAEEKEKLPQPLVSMKGSSFKVILKQYAQGLLYSCCAVAVNLPLVYCLSHITWHHKSPPGQQPAFTPNTRTYQLSLMVQCVFPLALYALVLYCCMKRTTRVPHGLLLVVAAVMTCSVTTAALFFVFDVHFWWDVGQDSSQPAGPSPCLGLGNRFYFGDFFYIALSYVPPMCAVGWYLHDAVDTTLRERLDDMLFTAVVETLVATSTILYCTRLLDCAQAPCLQLGHVCCLAAVLMPLFFLLNAWLQLLWMALLHPIYYELTSGFMVRKALRRNALRGRNDIPWFLSIVHATVHSVSVSAIMTSSIDSLAISVLTQVLFSAVRLVWRTTTDWRDMQFERLLHWDWRWQPAEEDRITQARLISLGIQTEMVLENASNVLAPWLIWCMWKEPLFMSVAPSSFVDGDSYPGYFVLVLIVCLLLVTVLFDLTFLLLNYHGLQQLPVIQTWRDIQAVRAWYMGFLVYALTFMGTMFLFITMMILPRASVCRTDNYCNCSIATYQGVCEGQFVSTWGGNIV
ncbi:hypothetical protein QJQ45_006914 [Haematococcus lacustris]|nr:hypothetical protein QJQ45_006914 [Haematococcus lacustris]